MLDSPLFTPHFIGRDKFVWWIGQVEKSVDTAKNSNRVKVRIIGYHSDRKAVPPEELPWSHILMPPTNSQSGGSGKKAMLTPGQWVVGFFLDGDEAQVPCIWGCLGGTIGTDIESTVPLAAYSTPQNLWAKPEMVTPTSVAKKSVNPSADSTNQMPHIAGSNESEDEFEKVDTGEVKPKILTEDDLASKGQVAKEKEQTYEVAVADGVCGANSVMDQMSTKISEFVEDISSVVKQGELWINIQTGAVMDMTAKIQNYATLIGNMLQGPISSIMRFAETQAKKIFPGLYAAAAMPDPFGLSGLKEGLDKVLSAIKCAFNSDILSGLGDLVKGILSDILNGVGAGLDALMNPAAALGSLLSNVVNAADCVLQSAIDKTLGSIMSGLNTVMDTISSVIEGIGGTIEQITGVISSVMGFAQQILGILDCINPDSKKCARTKVYSTKEGAKRPKKLFDMKNPDLDKALSDMAGAPLNVCEDAKNPTVNSQSVFASAVGASVSNNITGESGRSSGMEEIGETFDGYIPIEAVDQITDVDLANLDSADLYRAAQALSDSGILGQFTTSRGEGLPYGVSGILKMYDPSNGEYKIEGLSAPLIPGSWIRSSSGHCIQISASSIYRPKSPGSGRGARIVLPIDGRGMPAKDAIVYDGGSGYGNGVNGNKAPDAFVVTEMFDCDSKQPIEGYYLKGTVFVDNNGSIVSVTFNNEFGYCFKSKPEVAINSSGGSLGDPTEIDAVKDPNTLTNQTDTTLVINAENSGINGILQGFHITNVGSGYKNPQITITGGGGNGAEAEIVDFYGRILSVKITDSGSGYTSIPNILIKDAPIPGEDPNTFRGRGARVFPVMRYLSSSNIRLVEKLNSQEVVEVVDCP